MRSNGKGVKTCHGRNRCEGELSERGVVLAVDTLTLEDGELLVWISMNGFKAVPSIHTTVCWLSRNGLV